MFAIGGRLTGLACDPLPDLCAVRAIDKDNEMFIGRLGGLLVDLLPHAVVGKAATAIRLARKDLHPTFFGQAAHRIRLPVDLDV